LLVAVAIVALLELEVILVKWLELWAIELFAPVGDAIPLPLAVLVRAVIMFVGRVVSVPTMELIWLDKEAGTKTEPRELGFARAAEPIEEPRLSAAEVWEGV